MDRSHKRNIVVTIDLSTRAGNLKLAGIYRYLREEPRWDIMLVQGKSSASDAALRRAVRDADGVILLLPPSPALQRKLVVSRLPVVTIDFSFRRPATSRIGSVRVDAAELAKAAYAHFCALGRFSSFVYVHDAAHSVWSRARALAFSRELAAHGTSLIRLRNMRIKASDLRQLPKPSAVLVSDDRTAREFIRLCSRYHVKIPEAMAVLGIDNDIRYVLGSSPSISSIEPEFEREGYEAARLLDRLISGKRIKDGVEVSCGVNAVFQRETSSRRTPSEMLVARLEQYLSSNAPNVRGPSDVAAYLGVSRRLLDLRLRELSKPTLADMIRANKLKYLATLLRTDDIPIGVAIRRAGFENPNWVHTLFRRQHGMTMRQYRNLPVPSFSEG